MQYQRRSLGAYTSLALLTAFRPAAGKLALRSPGHARRQLSGPFQSKKHGRGMEFEDVRQYQPGDDVRNIDWRVTARTGQAHTKQYREEREKPVLVIVDQRSSMFFGSRKAMKSVLAADLAAYIAWASQAAGDRVGGLVFNDHSHHDIRPGRQRKNVLRLLQCISDYNQALARQAVETSLSWRRMLDEIRRISRPGTRIFLVSDFHDLNDSCDALLHELARHCEIIAIDVHDQLEQALPANGLYQAYNGRTTLRFASDKNNRQRYQQDFQQRKQDLKNRLNRFAIPLLDADTSQEPLELLQVLFGGRR